MRRYLIVTWLLLVVAVVGRGRSISVSELNYNPLGGGDYEFIELINSGTASVALTGARFTNGIDYTFSTMVLQPGQRVVVCGQRSEFQERHGSVAQLVSGAFGGNLRDEGEEISLVSASGVLLFQFTYDSTGAWPSRAAGLGSSMEVIDPNGDLSDPRNWRSSAEYHGSPGRAGLGPQRGVVINEVLAHTDPPLEDAIELYNNLDTPVDISGWYISNSREKPEKFRIPPSTIIAPRGYKVFYEYQFNAAEDPNAFTLNSAHGDETTLVSADVTGKPLIWMDATSFEASENGYSFARYPNGTGPLVPASDLSFGTAVRGSFPKAFLSEFRKGLGENNAAPRVGPIVMSRIQYQPPLNRDEFVELYNPTTSLVPLFDPAFPSNTWKFVDGVEYVFPQNLSLSAGARLIVCATIPAVFRARQSVPAETLVLGPWIGALNNAGERIALYRPDVPQGPQHSDAGFVPYLLVEEVDYLDGAPWPVGDVRGFLIQRKTTGYGNDPLNWWVDSGGDVTVAIDVSRADNGLQLRFEVPAGYGARVESRRLAESGDWVAIQNYPAQAGGRTQEWFYTIEGLQRVFRVALTPL